jgi:hydroxyacylglutathione hydrolase
MYLKQIYTGWHNEAAYFVMSDGEAIIIDPLRDVEEHLHLAKQHKAKIKYIFETHFHSDFLSGPLELSKHTGAPIVYGPKTETNFPFHLAGDGEIFKIGSITLEVIHTPGHTLESTCYLLKDESGKPHCIFTGDTLFIGEVGRPNPGSRNITSEELASMMYDTIRDKIMPLADDVIVYPANGPGSSCGKNPGPATITTIGEQKKNNYALQPQTREEFIAAVTNHPDTTPPYFSINAKIIKEGCDSFDEIKRKGLTPLSVKDLKLKIKNDILVLDTRSAKEFFGWLYSRLTVYRT